MIGGVKSILSVYPNWQITTPAQVQSLNPPARQKLSNMFDDTFLKWVYILFNSQDSDIVNLRTRVKSEELIQIAANATFVMMVAHLSTHKILPKNVLGLEPINREIIVCTLKDDYGLKDQEISDLLIILGK